MYLNQNPKRRVSGSALIVRLRFLTISSYPGKWTLNIWEEPSGDAYIVFEDAARTQVRAGTLNKLVQFLTSEEGLFKSFDDVLRPPPSSWLTNSKIHFKRPS